MSRPSAHLPEGGRREYEFVQESALCESQPRKMHHKCICAKRILNGARIVWTRPDLQPGPGRGLTHDVPTGGDKYPCDLLRRSKCRGPEKMGAAVMILFIQRKSTMNSSFFTSEHQLSESNTRECKQRGRSERAFPLVGGRHLRPFFCESGRECSEDVSSETRTLSAFFCGCIFSTRIESSGLQGFYSNRIWNFF